MTITKSMSVLLLLVGLLFSLSDAAQYAPCQESTVYPNTCECTDDYCDEIAPVGVLSAGEVAVYQSSPLPLHHRLNRTVSAYFTNTGDNKKGSGILIQVDTSRTFQRIVGFGGALTDAVAINFNMMDSAIQKHILASYYGDNGLQYTLGRIPIASCDFSTHSYSYDDYNNDYNMSLFSIDMDKDFKLPFIQQVLSTSSRDITLFGSPWSGPAWMKNNNNSVGGQLNGVPGDATHKAYAKYLSLFVTAYKQAGVNIWAITTQNEPTENVPWDSMYFDANTQAAFFKLDFGPIFRQDHPDVLIMAFDDQRAQLFDWAQTLLNDPEVAEYVDGLAMHWYSDMEDIYNNFDKMNQTHNAFPQKFILATEACTGYTGSSLGVSMGNWTRGQIYAHDVINDLENWSVGWTDWNILLNMQGGPNHAYNYIDSPMIVDTDKKNILYKQPMFYHLGHFSKFITAGSVRVASSVANDDSALPLEVTAAQTCADADCETVLVVLNRDTVDKSFTVQDERFGSFDYVIPAKSIQTFVYNN